MYLLDNVVKNEIKKVQEDVDSVQAGIAASKVVL